LVVVRDASASLLQISEIYEGVVECHPKAEVVVTAPLFGHAVDESLSAAGLLAIECLP
jgi:hypothetical protein